MACGLKTSTEAAYVSQGKKTKRRKEEQGRILYHVCKPFSCFAELYKVADFIATGKNMWAIIHPSIHTHHIHPLHSYDYLSLASHHQEVQISPPLYDATGRTCIATGGDYGYTGGRSKEEKNPKGHYGSPFCCGGKSLLIIDPFILCKTFCHEPCFMLVNEPSA